TFRYVSSSPTWGSGVGNYGIVAASDGGDRVVVVGTDAVVLVNIATGETLWEAPSLGVKTLGMDGGEVGVEFIDDATIWVESPSGSWLIDVATGEATPTDYRYAGRAGEGSVVADDGTSVALLVPDADRQEADTVPDGYPPCPSGMQVVAATQYPEGMALVCGSGKDFHVTARHHGKKLVAKDLTFAEWGWTVTGKDGTVVVVGLGGGLVVTPDGSWAAEGWSASTGRIGFGQVAVKQCSPGTVPLSLSMWDGGWFLVCGTDIKTPTFAVWEDRAAGSGESADVGPDKMGYCRSDGAVCTHPGEVVVSAGEVRPVLTDWFVTQGCRR
ncbi:MAG: hypothetical protein FWD11_03720, partial [Micrococcales bacterium]|nr:hypothetical protein [Micrococcales bacterium]